MNELTVLPPLPPVQSVTLKKAETLPNLWTMFVGLKGDLAPNTHVHYRGIGRDFCGFMDGKEFSPRVMVEWIQHLQPRNCARKINHTNIRIRSFIKFLRTMGYITRDMEDLLRDALPSLKEDLPKKPQIITEEEYEKIKKYATGRPWCQPQLWLCILAYRTGMSLVDCCNLRWRDVHLNENGPSFIDIYRIKTERLGQKALCQIPIIPFTDVHEWLLNLKKVEKDNYKRFDGITDFVHQDCPGLYQCRFQTIGNDFKNIFQRAGVTTTANEKSFKHFRNAFCSNLVNSGTQLALVCKMTGHQNVKTLLGYLLPDRRALQDGLARAFQFASAENGTGKGNDGFVADCEE